MPSILIQLRRQAAERQGWRCYYCTQPMWEADKTAYARREGMTLRAASDRRCTAEHLVARCDGGTDTADNVVAACRGCNSGRHARRAANAPSPEAYLLEVAARTISCTSSRVSAQPGACADRRYLYTDLVIGTRTGRPSAGE